MGKFDVATAVLISLNCWEFLEQEAEVEEEEREIVRKALLKISGGNLEVKRLIVKLPQNESVRC